MFKNELEALGEVEEDQEQEDELLMFRKSQ